MARSYAKGEKLNFDGFVQQIKEGANYVSDGRSHIIDFKANNVTVGHDGSEVKLAKAGDVEITADVFAYLPENQDESGALIAMNGLYGRPYWHIEKARIEKSRKVKVELVVNGYVAQLVEIEADGAVNHVAFKQPLDRSSWLRCACWGVATRTRFTSAWTASPSARRSAAPSGAARRWTCAGRTSQRRSRRRSRPRRQTPMITRARPSTRFSRSRSMTRRARGRRRHRFIDCGPRKK